MSTYLTPIGLITGVSFANHWYNTQQPDLKILVAGGIAATTAAVLSNIPDIEPVIAGIAWIAFVALMIAPVQNPSPLQNLEKLIS